jgi:LmbE family N-acetylglucosaminyl deacetylase
MPRRRFLIAVLCSLFTSPLFSQNHTSVYIVAHPDDWQLFMGNDAYNEIQDVQNKVVFIITTSGDASYNRPQPNLRFARSRERGVLNSVRFCADSKSVVDSTCRTKHVTINGHKILCYPYKHVKTYFMRLPDGCFSGGYQGQSLEYLHDGKIGRITAIDSSETYEGWQDVIQTMRAIITEETKNQVDISVNYQDHDRDYNPNDHPDHWFTGLAASQAAAVFPMIRHRGYIDYHVAEKPINLSGEEIAIKAGIFALADFGLTEEGDGSTFNRLHLSFVTRTYSRPLPSVDSAGNPFFPPGIKVFPNPASGTGVQVAFTANNKEKAALSLRDIQGNIVWEDSAVEAVKGENFYSIPLTDVTPGIYFVTLITSTGRDLVKMVRL